MADLTATIPKGSWVLVTGANGYIASHVIKEFLARGFRVRGTVRDLYKTGWVIEDMFSEEARLGNFALVQVPDLGTEGAFDDAIKGVSAIIHVATISTLDPNPHNVIPKDTIGMKTLLQAASLEASVKRFVFTSSFVTAAMPIPGVEVRVGPETWNDAAVDLAWAPPPYEEVRGMIVYFASKIEAEKTMWDFVSKETPSFDVNTVSPLMVFGTPLHKNHLRPGGTPTWFKGLFYGDPSDVANVPANIYTNVKDVAALHVAATLDPNVRSKRIQAWAVPFNWNDALAVMRKLYPNRQFIENLPGMGKLLHTTDSSLARDLLWKWKGDDWTTFEEGIRETLDALVEDKF